ncbi:CCC motif membrane protein [uncultured Rikenella sp.]|uniref:CCC motif membrane protein n=1 Tax=uncultured Rikenella sp. TaxID=368003 RepID=UPI0025FADBAF|nr:CCC motif membrane protein [uncultured Rikenella sp.]
MENYNENQPQSQPEQPQQAPQQPFRQPYQPAPQPQPRQGGYYPAPKPTLPNAAASLVLGILSVITSCWFVGLILGIIGLILGNKARRLYLAAPDDYNGYGMANAGRVLSIIGICIGGLYILYAFVILGIIGVGIGLSEAGDWFRELSCR